MRKTENQNEPNQIMFFSFGMFIIDEIHHLNSTKPPLRDLPGGAGLYALLGSRLLSPFPFSSRCSWILDAGSDFPLSIATQIQSWRTSTQIRNDDSRLTTRAWNGYGSNEHRAFRYLTPKRRLDVEDLSDAMVNGRGWHMVCSAGRCEEIVTKLERRRKEIGFAVASNKKMVVVWEPIPDLCTPEELEGLRRAAAGVDVVSPNKEELASYFMTGTDEAEETDQDEMVVRLMGWDSASDGIGSDTAATNATMDGRQPRSTYNTACIVREGSQGSTVYFPPAYRQHSSTSNPPGRTTTPASTGTTDTNPARTKIHLPAYHTPSTAGQVIDPTGGGNTYLGALALAMAYTSPRPSSSTPQPTAPRPQPRPQPAPPATPAPIQTVVEFVSALSPAPRSTRWCPHHEALLVAGICACVAAGYAIEQYGVPELTCTYTAQGDDACQRGNEPMELWGGSSVSDRIALYLAREGEGIAEQVRVLSPG